MGNLSVAILWYGHLNLNVNHKPINTTNLNRNSDVTKITFMRQSTTSPYHGHSFNITVTVSMWQSVTVLTGCKLPVHFA